LDYDLKALLTGELPGIDLTQYAQSALFLVSLATATVLDELGIKADACIGLSLGEYSAYAYAQGFSIADGTWLTRQRGLLMGEALPSGTSTMLAVLMLSEELTQQACDQVSLNGYCAIANYNAPGQLIVACEQSVKDQFIGVVKALGARKIIELNVQGGFHSELLRPASSQLKQLLEKITWQASLIPVYTNYSGLPTTDWVASLTQQLYSPVRFYQGIVNLLDAGYDCFIEVGPGNVLSSLVTKIANTQGKVVTVMQVNDLNSLNQTKQKWSEYHG
jgi:[acyl-carrier-protein] S-malonyltransferase